MHDKKAKNTNSITAYIKDTPLSLEINNQNQTDPGISVCSR